MTTSCELMTLPAKAKCFKCGKVGLRYYDGALGYESFVCIHCGHDVNDPVANNEIVSELRDALEMVLDANGDVNAMDFDQIRTALTRLSEFKP